MKESEGFRDSNESDRLNTYDLRVTLSIEEGYNNSVILELVDSHDVKGILDILKKNNYLPNLIENYMVTDKNHTILGTDTKGGILRIRGIT